MRVVFVLLWIHAHRSITSTLRCDVIEKDKTSRCLVFTNSIVDIHNNVFTTRDDVHV